MKILINHLVLPELMRQFLSFLLVGVVLFLPGEHVGAANTSAGDANSGLEHHQVIQTINQEASVIQQEQSGELIAHMVKGATLAPITIVEFADFQCPFCVNVVPTLAALLERYPDQVRLVFKHLPLPMHPKAPLAHEASAFGVTFGVIA